MPWTYWQGRPLVGEGGGEGKHISYFLKELLIAWKGWKVESIAGNEVDSVVSPNTRTLPWSKSSTVRIALK